MDARQFFYFVRRKLTWIVSSCLIFLVITFLNSYVNNESKDGALMFLSLGVERNSEIDKENYNPREAVEAADRFTDTVQGWIKNPSLMSRMNEVAGVGISLSARKQEKQNLLLDLQLNGEGDLNGVADKVLNLLRSEIDTYNKATNSSFRIAINTIETYESGKSIKFNLLASLLFGAFFALFLAIILEYYRGVVSLPIQLLSIFGKKEFACISDREELKRDKLLGTFLGAKEKKIVIAGVNFDSSSYVLPIVQSMSLKSDSNIALVDFDLEKRELHKIVQLEESKLLGVTDLTSKNFSVIGDYLKPLERGVKFLSAGQGTSWTKDLLEILAGSSDQVVLHSNLPNNSEILALGADELVLLVKLGESKEFDLRRIKDIFKGNIDYLIIN